MYCKHSHTHSRHLEKLNLERVSFLRCSWRQVTAACGAVSASPRRTWPAPNPRPSARMHAQPTERGCRSYNCRICGEPKKGHVCGSTDTAVEAESTGPTCESAEQAEMPVEKPAEPAEKRVQKKRKRATSEGRRTRSKV